MATKNWTDYQVGQQVFFVSKHGGKNLLTISSVGRKWCRFESARHDWRAEKGTARIEAEGYGSVGSLYESQEAYEQYLADLELRKKIREVDWGKIDLEKLKVIAEILEVPNG
jgi:hypothetical protein